MVEEKTFKLKGKTLTIIDWANVYGWTKKLKWEIDPKKLYDYLKGYPKIYDIRFYFGIEKGNEKSEKFHQELKNIGYNVVSKDVKWVPVFLEKSHFKQRIKELHKTLLGMIIKNQRFSIDLLELVDRIDRIIDGTRSITPEGEIVFTFYDKKELKEIYEKIIILNKEIQNTTKLLQDTLNSLKTPIYRRKCDFDVEITMDVLKSNKILDGLILFSGDGDYKPIAEYLLNNEKQIIIIHPYGLRGREFNELLTRKTNRPFFYPVEKLKPFLK